MTSPSIDPSCSRTISGSVLFSDELLDALLDQGAGDVGQAALDEGFEKGHFLFERLRQRLEEQRFKRQCQLGFREGVVRVCADFCCHGFGHEGCQVFLHHLREQFGNLFSVRSDMDWRSWLKRPFIMSSGSIAAVVVAVIVTGLSFG